MWCCTCTWPEYILFVRSGNIPQGVTVDASLFSWRLHRFDSGEAKVARADDGALAFHYRNSARILFGLVRGVAEQRRKYEPREHQSAYDPNCERAVKLVHPHAVTAPMHDTILGHRVLLFEHDSDHESGSMALAPDLGCLVMRSSYRRLGPLGIPIEIARWEVTAVKRGSPDRRLFDTAE